MTGGPRRPGNPRNIDYNPNQLSGKYLSYRGQASETATLFTSIVHNAVLQQLASIDIEINNQTGTIAVTVAAQGYLGFQYYYYTIKRTGH